MNRKGFSKILIIIAVTSIFLGAWTYYKLETKPQFKQINPKIAALALNSPESPLLKEYFQREISNLVFPGGSTTRHNYLKIVKAYPTGGIYSSACANSESEAFNWVQKFNTDRINSWNSRSSGVDKQVSDEIILRNENKKYYEFFTIQDFKGIFKGIVSVRQIRVHKCNYIIFNDLDTTLKKSIIATFQQDVNLESARELFEYIRSETISDKIDIVLKEKLEELDDSYQFSIVTLHYVPGWCGEGEIFIDKRAFNLNKNTKEILLTYTLNHFSDLITGSCSLPSAF